MVTAAELAAEVRRATANTPYMVADETPTGFTVQIDIVDQQWSTLMKRKSLESSFQHLVTVDAASDTYTVTDRQTTVTWEAGLDAGGVPRPVLRASKSVQQGMVVSKSFRKEVGMDDDGNVGAVVGYSFDSSEGKRLIDGPAQHLGLTKKMNSTAKVGLTVAAVAVGGLLIGLVVLLIVLAVVL
ncbi:hypothetical protein [Nocardioides zeae]|uniref:Uncharacterized protein n=1 Tax=Nocardioides zeae TaxID=1457234 RepID=A0AAJ1TXU5_9ACTN|nr:hypothetical protein [Nocardioides zeae]MDQ1103739.1 hypothetical protein [Nocardioides zeae]